MRDVGVSSKVSHKARQASMRSAKQAGFFEHGEDRLVKPSASPGPGTKPIEGSASGAAETADKRNGSGDGGGPTEIDPIIRGLLVRLPKSGSVWPESERKLWLQLLEGSFKLISKE